MSKGKMQGCDDCGAEISRLAEVCPKCGRRYRIAVLTGSLLRDIFYAVVFLAALRLLFLGG